MIDDLKLIKYFTTLMDLESEPDTARCYNMSQPSIHLAVKRLEESLGAVLYKRGAQKVKSEKIAKGKNTDQRRYYHLTPAGEVVYRFGQLYMKLDNMLMEELTALHKQQPPVKKQKKR